jgi:hypothetical protein
MQNMGYLKSKEEIFEGSVITPPSMPKPVILATTHMASEPPKTDEVVTKREDRTITQSSSSSDKAETKKAKAKVKGMKTK